MKVRLTVDLSDADRYLIATYFRESGVTFTGGRGGGGKRSAFTINRTRRRATREQARLYLRGALRLCLRERLDALAGRTKTVALRLERKAHSNATIAAMVALDAVTPPLERNRRLFP